MPCYHPVDAYQSENKKPNGKSSIYFTFKPGSLLKPIKLPCGGCVGCRYDRSKQWAIRINHEASLYENNCFITLTYSPQNLPDGGTLVLHHFQKFMKRLRKKYGEGIRFFHCGEYGEQLGRPHYHAIIFNFDFPDKTPWKKTKQGHTVWRSKSLEELWPYGISEIGSVTFESAAYVARYILKKINGELATSHYKREDAEGRIYFLKPEYITMSRRPGIASDWFKKFSSDVFPHDHVVMRGRTYKPPKFYDRQYEILDPEDFKRIKIDRENKAKVNALDNTPERLYAKEEVAKSRLKNLPRTLK